MFYFLSKIIDFLAMPLTLLIGLIIWAIFSKNNKNKVKILCISLVYLYIISNLYIAMALARWYETPYQSVTELKGTYDVGVLLTGGITFAHNPKEVLPSMGNRPDRVLQTFHLYQHKKIKKIIITGHDQNEFIINGTAETQLAKQLLVSWGIPEEDIRLELKARNTRENALFTTAILQKEYKDSSVLLITSAFHMRRSLGCFEKAGTQATPFRTDFGSNIYSLSLKEKLVPNPIALSLTHTLWHEWIGFLVYKLMGYC